VRVSSLKTRDRPPLWYKLKTIVRFTSRKRGGQAVPTIVWQFWNGYLLILY
jgi:hypothetical protein